MNNEQENQRAASYTGTGSTAEYELTKVLNYQIKGDNNLVLLENKVEARKFFMQDTGNIAGSTQEASMVRKELDRDLVQQVLLRLEQLTPARLAELQTLADEKARAEAAALEAQQKAEAETPQQSPLELP